MQVKVKKLHPDAVIPKYAHPGDAGVDLTAVGEPVQDDKGCIVYRTGLAMDIPKGHVGLIFPRSSVAKMGVRLSNAVGVIDSSYKGEIMAKFDPSSLLMGSILNGDSKEDVLKSLPQYKAGDRIAQLIIMPYPEIEMTETEDIGDSERGNGGFGSSGR